MISQAYDIIDISHHIPRHIIILFHTTGYHVAQQGSELVLQGQGHTTAIVLHTNQSGPMFELGAHDSSVKIIKIIRVHD
jgi:hypothetical protein